MKFDLKEHELYKALQRRGILTVLYGGLFLFVMVACASQVNTNSQISVAIACGVALLVIRRFDQNETVRVVFLIVSLFISVDYFFWRTFSTLTYYDFFSFTCAVILYLAELYGFIVYVLSLFVNIDPLDRLPAEMPADKTTWPTVDIFIPSYNEDISILEITIISALQVRYPKEKVHVYLLDDGGTDQRCNSEDPDRAAASRKRRVELKELCQKVGAIYLTREKNVHAKAGNINNALLNSDGELVLILDADHAPTADILENTIGWFLRDEKMFLVQTPHFFSNPDPIEKNLDTFERMPSENEMFYKVIQRGLDFWNAAFFCGSAAVLRRTFLREVGGIAGDTITEDAETALTLHARGYNSAYIGIPMISGLSPETFGGFIGQRIRWAQGMVQIFLLKNPLLIPGLTLPQRLCYFSSCFFWFFSFARLIFMIAPAAFLLFGLKIYDANFVDFSAFAVPHLFAVIMVSDYLFGKVRWSFVSELYELMQSVYTLPAIMKVFLNPRAPTFNVTTKGETLDRDFISPLSKPFYLLLLLNIVSISFGFYKLVVDPLKQFPTAITMVWALFNVVILLAALGALLERRQRRATARLDADQPGTLLLDGRPLPARITDFSNGGASMEIDRVYEPVIRRGMAVTLLTRLPGQAEPKPFNAAIRNVRIRGGVLFVGMQFQHASLEEMKDKIAMVNGNSERWQTFQAKRENHIGVMRSFLFLFYCGIRYSVEHAGHLILSSASREKSSEFNEDPVVKTA